MQEDPVPCVCPECGLVCKNIHVLNGHRAGKHGWRNPLKKHMAGSHCLVCLKDFGNRMRLCEHVIYRSKYCGTIYRKHVSIVPPDRLDKQEAALAASEKSMKWQGKHIRYAELPVVRICGPPLDRVRLLALMNNE